MQGAGAVYAILSDERPYRQAVQYSRFYKILPRDSGGSAESTDKLRRKLRVKGEVQCIRLFTESGVRLPLTMLYRRSILRIR